MAGPEAQHKLAKEQKEPHWLTFLGIPEVDCRSGWQGLKLCPLASFFVSPHLSPLGFCSVPAKRLHTLE